VSRSDRRSRGGPDPSERSWSPRDKREATEGFRCCNKDCNAFVPVNAFMGTQNRNHCPLCLHSRHVDERRPGDRKADCGAAMAPQALAFKFMKPDKYGNERVGELMLVHVCPVDERISPNRIAADDNTEAIEAVFALGVDSDLAAQLAEHGVRIATPDDVDEVRRQLYGAAPA